MRNSTIEKIRRKIRSFIYTSGIPRASSRFETDDIVQDVFVQMAGQHNLNLLHSTQINTVWLKKAANGSLCKSLRFNLADKRSLKKESGNSEYQHEVSEVSPVDEAMRRELGLLFLCCVDQLEPVERKIVQGRFFKHETFRQIADRLELTVYRTRTDFENAVRKLHLMMSSEL